MLNVVALQGRLARDPELRQTTAGRSVCNFTIACDAGKERTDWFDVVAWEKSAEFICKYFGKGSMIMLDGEMQTQQYEDRNGNPATWYDVAVDRVCFTGEPKKENGSNGGYNRSGGNGGYGNSGYNGGKRSYGNRQNSYGNNSYNGQQSFNAPPADDYPF